MNHVHLKMDQFHGSINSEKIDDNEENNKIDIFKIS